MTAQRASLLLLLPLLLPLPGCMGNRHGRPEHIASESLRPRGRLDTPAPVAWRQVLIGAPNATVRGYVRSTEHLLEERTREKADSHQIYDRDFRLVGRCSPRGWTYRIDAAGQEKSEGNLPLDVACLLLLKAGRTDNIELVRMPAPRS